MLDRLLRQIIRFNHWRKGHLSQNTFLIIAAGLVGVLGGLASSALKKLTHVVADYLQNDLQGEHKFLLYFFFPIIGLFLTVAYLKLFIRRKPFRQGIPPLINSILHRRSRLDLHNVYSQIISSAFTVGMGGSAGLESPAVASGAAAGSNVGRLFGLNHRETTLLLACGGAAGISGAFDSPVAGLVFALEVLLPAFTIPAIIPLLLASAVASVISWMVYNRPLFAYIPGMAAVDSFWIYVLFGIAAGFFSVYYAYMNEAILKRLGRLKNAWAKAGLGGIALGALIALFPALYGEGYISIQKLLSGDHGSLLANSLFSAYQPHAWALLLYAAATLLLKAVAPAITMGSGGNGGMFGPSVVIGGLLGFVFAYGLNLTGLLHLNITHFVVVGMAGSISGVMHAPLTGVFLAAEITGGYALMVPLMIVSAISFFINKRIRKYSIYTKGLAEQGALVIGENQDEGLLSRLRVRSLAVRSDVILSPGDTATGRKEDILRSDRSFFPVVDAANRLLGTIGVERLLEAAYSPDPTVRNRPLGEVAQPSIELVRPDMPMHEVLLLMNQRGKHTLPVVDGQGYYVGYLSKDAIFNAYRKLLVEQGERA
ncbi:MAG: chloride channel protein [Flavobacteriales bacterium]|nr:chloride channel protein [Flavobacteriales bacterium]